MSTHCKIWVRIRKEDFGKTMMADISKLPNEMEENNYPCLPIVRKQLWENFDVINTDNYINTFGKVSINHIERKNKNNKGIRLFKL